MKEAGQRPLDGTSFRMILHYHICLEGNILSDKS